MKKISKLTIISLFAFFITNNSIFCAEKAIWTEDIDNFIVEFEELDRGINLKTANLAAIMRTFAISLAKAREAYDKYENDINKSGRGLVSFYINAFPVLGAFIGLKTAFDQITAKIQPKDRIPTTDDFTKWFIKGIDTPIDQAGHPLSYYAVKFMPEYANILADYGAKIAIPIKPELKKLEDALKAPRAKDLLEAIKAHNLSIDDVLKNINQYIDKSNGITVLMYAANLGLSDIVNLLLDAGANPLIKTKETAPNIPPNWTALDFAKSRGNKNTVRTLAEYDLKSLISKTDLKDILSVHKLTADDFLKDINQYVDKTHGITLLMYAVNLGLLDAIKALLDLGVDKTKKSLPTGIFGGQTAIQIAETKLGQAKSDIEKFKFQEIIQLLSN